jgi:hypothetical protein
MSKFSVFAVILSILIALPVSAQQANTAGVASLTVGGVGAAGPGPFTVNIPAAASTSVPFVFGGAALSPWALISADPALGGVAAPAAGGMFPPIGILDVGPLGIVSVPLDGIAAIPGSLPAALLRVGPGGTSTYPFTITVGACGSVVANVQGLLSVPGPPFFLLTAAFSIGAGLPDSAPVALAQGDDTSVAVPFNGCAGYLFYGIARPTFNVNSNGNISFGGANTTFTESQAGFVAGLAKICPCWDDFNFAASPAGVMCTKFDTVGSVVVSWSGVAEFGFPATLNTFASTMVVVTGSVVNVYGAMSTLDGLTGITAGPASAPVTVLGPGAPPAILRITDHIAGGGLGPLVGVPMESHDEVFTSPATATTGVFNLAGGPPVTWGSTGPASYTLF